MRVLMIGAGGVALTRPLDWVVKAGYEVWLLGDVDPYETEAPKNYRYFPTVWRKYLAGLRQKLSPNKAQTSFISSKYVTVEGQPVKKSIRDSCSKGF